MTLTKCCLALTALLVSGRAISAEVKSTDDPLCMPYYTGKILPTPQQAVYRDDVIPLASVAVTVGQDVVNADPLVEVLTERIRRYGGKTEVVDSLGEGPRACISLGDTPVSRQVKGTPEVPGKPQGYILHAGEVGGRPVVVLKGSDRQGMLWAISSFCQLVHRRDGETVARAAEVEDFPVGRNRGYLHGNVNTFSERVSAEQSALYNVAFKFNKPVYKHLAFDYNRLKMLFRSKRSKGLWRNLADQTEVVQRNIKDIGKLLTPLGIEWYGGFHPVIGPVDTKLNGSPEDIRVMLHYARQVAEAGGHFYMQLDDFRFPLHPYDKEQFGTAAKADVHILTELVKGLREDFPKTRIMVCPPFYWGPTSPSAAWYGEPRDDYLSAVGKLPGSIELQWTGPKVKSNVVKKEHVEWITERIKRKPVYWQNAWESPHPNFVHYATDPVRCWPEWYYEGFATDIDCMTYNSTFPGNFVLLATVADYFWNPKAYDPEASVAEAARKLAGPDCYETLVELNKILSAFDSFGFTVTPAAAKHADELEAKAEEAEKLWAKVETQSKAAAAYTPLGGVVFGARRYVTRLRSNPNLAKYVKEAEIIKADAVKEAKLDEKTDQFLTPFDFIGGYGPRPYANQCPKRVAVWIYGTNTTWKAASAQIKVSPIPATSDYDLIVSGQDDEAEKPCGIRVTWNKRTIYEGECPFKRQGWSTHTFRIPAAILGHENRLVIENTDPGYFGAAPWLMVNYAILRKAPKE